ncbi:MAG: hypothetical protein R3B13_39510 [Polyangiaceae bacterium]
MVQSGGLIVDVLYSGDLVAWIKAENLKISVVKPKAGDPTLTELVSREWSYIVDLKTMKIVWKGFGSYGGTAPTSMQTALDQLSTLLSQQ